MFNLNHVINAIESTRPVGFVMCAASSALLARRGRDASLAGKFLELLGKSCSQEVESCLE